MRLDLLCSFEIGLGIIGQDMVRLDNIRYVERGQDKMMKEWFQWDKITYNDMMR